MSQTAAELLKAAMELPPDERGELAERLLDTLDPPGSDIDAMTDEEFAAELDRRAAEMRADPSAGVPWEEVKRKLLDM